MQLKHELNFFAGVQGVCVFVHCGLVVSTVASQGGGVEYKFPLQSLHVLLEHVLIILRFSSFLSRPKTRMSH